MAKTAKKAVTNTKKKRKTPESFGMIDPLPSGYYRARYTGPDGKRHPAAHTFVGIAEARIWLAQVKVDIAAGTWQPPEVVAAAQEKAAAEERRRQVRLRDYAASWTQTRTNSRGEPLRVRTREEYERLLRAPGTNGADDAGGPLADFLDVVIGDITPEAVRSWRAERMTTGTKTQTARAYDLLKSILKTAVDDGLIPANPCTIRGGSSSVTGKVVEPPTDDQLEVILRTIRAEYRPLVVIAAAGGLRWGEATELRANDITIERDDDGNVDAARIRVERQVVLSKNGRDEGDVKSLAGVRTVAVFGSDAEIVAEQAQGKIGRALLTTNTAGTGWLPQSSFWRHWHKAVVAAGRPEMPFHALRHYAGTRYAQTGATVAETMARLGHSSSSAAMRYQHSGSRDDELARRMARRS